MSAKRSVGFTEAMNAASEAVAAGHIKLVLRLMGWMITHLSGLPEEELRARIDLPKALRRN